MISRTEVLRGLLKASGSKSCFISALGYLSRDLYALTANCRERCFYCMGSMGSVIPFALGVSLTRVDREVIALEGDGSLMANLGTLATVVRYGTSRGGGRRAQLILIVFDNRLYESTGGEPSQHDDLRLENVCAAVGLATFVIKQAGEISQMLETARSKRPRPAVLIAKTRAEPPTGRIGESPLEVARRFASWLGTSTMTGTDAWTSRI